MNPQSPGRLGPGAIGIVESGLDGMRKQLFACAGLAGQQNGQIVGGRLDGLGTCFLHCRAAADDVLKHVLPPALLILAVLGSIFAGIATVTEASGVGALMTTLLAIAYKKFNLQVLKGVLHATFNTNAYIFGILIGATSFALVLRGLGGDEFIERALTGLPFGPYGVIGFILFCVFVLGFFLDWVEITLIILPWWRRWWASWASTSRATGRWKILPWCGSCC